MASNTNGNDDGEMRATQSDAVSLTDALPAEMLCKVVAFFRAHPSQWMALLLTSRAVAAAARTVLDPASDHVRSGTNARAPTLAARLVAQYADAVPRVLDAYRCANASALLVEACRAGNIALMRTLIAERARWRVDMAYRHNRALLECVRLHSAVGVQLLLATGEVDPTDYPGAAHAGRCALHDGPACRRPDHPEPCEACTRGQQHGPWSDSDTDDEADGNDDDDDYEAYIDIIDHSDPLADTDEDDMTHDEGDLWLRRRPTNNERNGDGGGNNNDNDDDNANVDQHGGALSHSGVPRTGDVVITTSVVPGGGGDDDDDDNHFGVDYDALFEHEVVTHDGDDGAGVYGAVFGRTTRQGAWSLDDVNGHSDREDGQDDDDSDDDYEQDHSHDHDYDIDHRTNGSVCCGDGRDDGESPDPGASRRTARTSARRTAATNAIVDRRTMRPGEDGPLSADPYAHVYASISRDDAFSDEGSLTGDHVVDCEHHPVDNHDNNNVSAATVAVADSDTRTDRVDGYGDSSCDEDHDDQDDGAASWSMNAQNATTSSDRDGAPDPTSSGHALAIRRAHLAQCICRRGMAFAIVWIDSDGREIGGRAGARTADPLWFLVCDDPSALVADGPLSFLMNGGRARDLTPTRGAAFVSSDTDAHGDNADAVRTTDTIVPLDSDAVTGDADNSGDGATRRSGNAPGNHRDAVIDNDGSTSTTALDGRERRDDAHHHDNNRDDHENHDQDGVHRTVEIVTRPACVDDTRRGIQPTCTCESQGRVAYSRAMERWCPLFWAALMSVGVLGQLLGHMAAVPPGTHRWACRFQDVLAMAASQIIVFSSASRMEALSDVHAAALDLALTSGGIDLAVHGDFLVAFAADRGCSDVVEMLVEYDAVDAGAHNDLALRRALWRYVRLYRPIQGAGAHLEPEERLNRMALYGATLIALAAAIGLDTGGMEPADAHMEPIDEGFVRSLARRVYPGLTPNDIGRLRLPPLRPHYPPPFTRP
ncbi:hypothetical protein pmac_cds_145 [Pandoravirus macleodensis]|uniref:Uncharacterized protein n=1 Tax=Pandoravirus macleodensis TaxID=2107707 RepID=A0A2U7UEG5_9VIRU|nr:hypothetical protein pmac_cds_145 [Pandoravirus macleodensis]AVK76833.1 hypothetical protein pmac_cds_145 [Pandoravirus macleodensis]